MHFTLTQRQQIETMLQQDASQTTIARSIGKSRSSVSRELKRNAIGKVYCAAKAHQLASERKSSAATYSNSLRKLVFFKSHFTKSKASNTKSQSALNLFEKPNLGLQQDLRINRHRTELIRFTRLQFEKRFRIYVPDPLFFPLDKLENYFTFRPQWKLLFRFRLKFPDFFMYSSEKSNSLREIFYSNYRITGGEIIKREVEPPILQEPNSAETSGKDLNAKNCFTKESKVICFEVFFAVFDRMFKDIARLEAENSF